MKTTKKTAFLSIGLITALIASISTVFAFGKHHYDPEKRANHIVEKITKKLSLNTEQQGKLAIAKAAGLKLHRNMHQSRETLGQDLMSIVSGDTLDENLILNRINLKTDTIREAAPEVVASIAAFYNSLDAKQQEKVRNKLEKKMHHIRNHHDDD